MGVRRPFAGSLVDHIPIHDVRAGPRVPIEPRDENMSLMRTLSFTLLAALLLTASVVVSVQAGGLSL